MKVERKITFYHEGHLWSAQALYSEKDLQTILLFLPEDLVNDFDESLLFSRDKNNCWNNKKYHIRFERALTRFPCIMYSSKQTSKPIKNYFFKPMSGLKK